MSCPHRLETTDYRGYRLYFLTIGTYSRALHFAENAAVELVWLHFLRTATAAGFDILAYRFMPDDLHMVVAGLREGSEFPHSGTRREAVVGIRFCPGFPQTAVAAELLRQVHEEER